jgi:alkylation response protein AidB-like acyl-CoA dehydrogenase
MGLAHVHDGHTPRLGADGGPVTILTMCPAAEAVILDTWRTLGMRGTGSHDVVMSDVFVPARHTALLAPYEKPGSAYGGPLIQVHRVGRDNGAGDASARHRAGRD